MRLSATARGSNTPLGSRRLVELFDVEETVIEAVRHRGGARAEMATTFSLYTAVP